MKTVFAAAFVANALLTATQPAHATDWYILNVSAATCDKSIQLALHHNYPALLSPDSLRSELIRVNDFQGIEVARDDDGSIREVSIRRKGNKAIHYFATRDDCLVRLMSDARMGKIVDPKELR